MCGNPWTASVVFAHFITKRANHGGWWEWCLGQGCLIGDARPTPWAVFVMLRNGLNQT